VNVERGGGELKFKEIGKGPEYQTINPSGTERGEEYMDLQGWVMNA